MTESWSIGNGGNEIENTWIGVFNQFISKWSEFPLHICNSFGALGHSFCIASVVECMKPKSCFQDRDACFFIRMVSGPQVVRKRESIDSGFLGHFSRCGLFNTFAWLNLAFG